MTAAHDGQQPPSLADEPGTAPLPRSDRVMLLVLAALGMLGPFSVDTMFPGFAAIGADLGVSEVALQQLVSVYLLAFALMSLVHGPLSDSLGRKPVMLTGIAVYAVASIGCALAPNLTVLLICRAVQGLTAGASTVVSRAVVRDVYHGPAAQRMMSTIAMIFGLAPALAPIIGGWLVLDGSWRRCFVFLVGLSIVVGLMTAFLLPETHPVERRAPLNLAGVVGGLREVIARPIGRGLSLTIMLTFAGMFGYISAAPIIVVSQWGRGAGDFWMLFLPLIGGMVVGSWTGGRLADRVPAKTLAARGYAIAIVGALVVLALSLPDQHTFPWLALGLPVHTFGMALAFPVANLALLDFFPAHRGAAASVQGCTQLLANAAIAGIGAPLLARWLPSLALAALLCSTLGGLLWRHYSREWLPEVD